MYIGNVTQITMTKLNITNYASDCEPESQCKWLLDEAVKFEWMGEKELAEGGRCGGERMRQGHGERMGGLYQQLFKCGPQTTHMGTTLASYEKCKLMHFLAYEASSYIVSLGNSHVY